MQEEITGKTIMLAVNTTKLTAGVLERIVKAYLSGQGQKIHQSKQGKQTVKDLVKQNAGVSNIEITDGNIRSFDRVAKKYHVDYAIKKDKNVNPPKYMVFFKARDADVLTQAFRDYVHANERKAKKRVSVKKNLEHFRSVVEKQKLRVKEHIVDRGRKL
mgnify:FL=1